MQLVWMKNAIKCPSFVIKVRFILIAPNPSSSASHTTSCWGKKGWVLQPFPTFSWPVMLLDLHRHRAVGLHRLKSCWSVWSIARPQWVQPFLPHSVCPPGPSELQSRDWEAADCCRHCHWTSLLSPLLLSVFTWLVGEFPMKNEYDFNWAKQDPLFWTLSALWEWLNCLEGKDRLDHLSSWTSCVLEKCVTALAMFLLRTVQHLHPNTLNCMPLNLS